MTIGFIGFGEAATAIVEGWRDDHIDVGEIARFDIIKDRTNTSSIADLTQQCETVFSTVTADKCRRSRPASRHDARNGQTVF